LIKRVGLTAGPFSFSATLASVKIAKISSGELHRVALLDDAGGHVAIAIGDAVVITSDGEHGWRRSNPGNAYGLLAHDGAIVWVSTGIASTDDFGATWRRLVSPASNALAIFRDSKATIWVGCFDGRVYRTKNLETAWKPAFKARDKVVSFTEIAGKLFVAGADSGVWNGKTFTSLPDLKGKTVTRISRGPRGAIVAVGDHGVAFTSSDGKRFTYVNSNVTGDIEDCAWVGKSLYAVGDEVVCSDDEGRSYKKVAFEGEKLWGIASWGAGAVMVGEDGMYTLAEPGDPYWQDATDRYAPPPPRLDPSFKPRKARSAKERDAMFAELIANALPDANPELAALVDAGTKGAEAIYADWLSDAGDPRGELAQIQLRLAQTPKHNRKQLKLSERALLETHATVWRVPDLKLEWTAGFISTALVTDPADVVGSPSARFLRKLEIAASRTTFPTFEAPRLKALEVVQVDKKRLQAILGSVLPSLEELTLVVGATDLTLKDLAPLLDGVIFPRLRKLGILAYDRGRTMIEALASSRLLPQLAELDVSGNNLADIDVARLFALQKGFVHLEKLVLADNYLSATSESLLVQAGLAVTFGNQRDASLADDEAFRIRLV
jgi:hypothetical protein